MKLKPASLILPFALLAIASCKPAEPEVPEIPEPTATPSEEAEPVSILRPDVEAETAVDEEAPSESYIATIGFPEGGSELDADAVAALEKVAGSKQFASTGAIVLRTHSDSAGSDTANAKASEERGLAVAEWLISAGADPRRIDVIVFGEQNPAQPNALQDGSPNEAGRALNRRVELEIVGTFRESSAPSIEFDQNDDSKAGDEP